MNREHELRRWLVHALSTRLKLAPEEIDPRAPFEQLGLDSAEAVSLVGELETWLGQPLEPTLLWDHPSIEALIRHVAGETKPEAAPARNGPTTEAIAVIGVGCRFPGASGPQAYWRLLSTGVDAITEVPADRWRLEDLYDPDPGAPGKMTTRWGGFVREVDGFDPDFFSIPRREAHSMDPQQRLLLEVAWEALEDAGVTKEQLAGSRTGVFVGVATHDYGTLQLRSARAADSYALTGSAGSIAANRLSYFFDLRGPSLAIDTACSSSLVAVHLACRSIASGECDRALVGGVNLMLLPSITVGFSKGGFMSPDGRCRSFDAGANGIVRSEGAGVVMLKPLKAALADRDQIYAVIRGSAVNQDGRSNGLTAPNGEAQASLLAEAYEAARIAPHQVTYVETHGTGTPLGDPIEARALGEVLGRGRDATRPCLIGSVKSNIGHLEAAAGIAGLIKLALCLKHKAIPPSLHFVTPNPNIQFSSLGLEVVTALRPLPEKAVVGVSSFGFGGTNAHVVLEPAPVRMRTEPIADERPRLLVLSAHSKQALTERARDLAAHLEAGQAPSFSDLCFTGQSRRSHLKERLAVVARNTQEARKKLAAFATGELAPGVTQDRAGALVRRLVFVFPGQGGQWVAMGRQLIEEVPAFAEAIARCETAMRPHLGWSVTEALRGQGVNASLDGVAVVQPCVFAMQVGLAALWASRGVVPDAVVGHSMGEVAAATVAGAMSLEDAALIICRRSQLMKRAAGRGAMAVVELSVEAAKELIRHHEGKLGVAAINGPQSTVLWGEPATLNRVMTALQEKAVFCRLVQVDVASHSPGMDSVLSELLSALKDIAPRRPTIPLYSTVSGVPEHSPFDASYWAKNLRNPVAFWPAVQALRRDGFDAFVEVSPHPVLLPAIADGLRSDRVLTVPSMMRDRAPLECLAESLGALFASGVVLDWARAGGAGRLTAWPPYPFQRSRFWLDDVGPDEPSASVATTQTTLRDDVLALPPEARAAHILERVRVRLTRVLKADPASVNVDASLVELGLDSIMAMELRNWVERELSVRVPVVDLLGKVSLRALSVTLSAELEKRAAPTAEASLAGQTDEELLEKIETLTPGEVDALLLRLSKGQGGTK